MKSSTAMLGALFLVVAAALFVGVYLILSGTSKSGGENPNIPPVELNGDSGINTGTRRGTRRNGGRNGPGGRPTPITLKITGIVTDADGEPLSGVTVRQFQPGLERPEKSTAVWKELMVLNGLIDVDEEETDRPRPLASMAKKPARLQEQRPLGIEIIAPNTDPAVTDDEGRFTLEFGRAAGAGPFVLRAEKAGAGEARATGVRAGAEIEMRIGSKSTVKGVILSAEEGHAVPDAYIVLDDGEKQFAANAGPDGRFVLEGLGPGQYRATAGAADFPPLTNHLVQVRKDEDLELRLPRGVTLRVLATSEPDDNAPDGTPPRPLAGATIVAMHEVTYAYIIGETGADGRVTFAGLPPGNWLVNGEKEGFATDGESVVKLDPVRGAEDLELPFEVTVSTPILVVDGSDRPLEGVTFFTNTWSDQYEQVRSRRIPGQSDAGGRFAFHFEFDGPRAMIYAFKKGYGIQIIAPQDETDGTQVKVVMRKGATVSGVVTDEEGKPVPGAIVSIECTPDDVDAYDDPIIWIITDEQGRYSFDYLPMGEVMIESWFEDGMSDTVDFEVDGTRWTFTADLKFD